jgi:hypothetical protein
VSYPERMSKRPSHPRVLAMRIAVLGIAPLCIGSTTLTPLYPVYQQEFGFSESRPALAGACG